MNCMFKAIHYCLMIYWKTFGMCLTIYKLEPAHFLTAPRLAW